jgi:L-rhamnose mutarotase
MSMTSRSLFEVAVDPASLNRYQRLHDKMPAAVRAEIREEGIVDIDIFCAGDRVVVCARSETPTADCLARLARRPAYSKWAQEFVGVSLNPTPTYANLIWRL